MTLLEIEGKINEIMHKLHDLKQPELAETLEDWLSTLEKVIWELKLRPQKD